MSRSGFACALGALVALAALTATADARATATLILDITDPDGVGFNDPTPAAPVGGNTGTTVGAQRRQAFQHALDIWGQVLDSPVPIHISASFAPLECTGEYVVLGQAGPANFQYYVPGQDPNVLFPEALADRIVGCDLSPRLPDIYAEFNGDIPGCFPGMDWYYGTDAAAFDELSDLVMTVLHEIGHGLGFMSTVNNETGSFISDGMANPFTLKLLDTTTGKGWGEMTDAERMISAGSIRGLVWTGQYGNAAGATWLTAGAPRIRTTPAVTGLNDALIDANFGRPLAQGVVSGAVAAPIPADGCSEMTGVNGAIAVLPEATCHPLNQLNFAEYAGAIAGIVVTNEAPPPALDQSMEDLAVVSTTLPVVGMTEADASLLLAASGVTVELYADSMQRTGADAEGRVYIFASDPITTSSAAHLEPVMRPDGVLEPSQTANIHHDVTLERAMLRDIGWGTSCGNGMIDAGEECDNGTANSDTAADACRTTCLMADCGDGVVDTGEACDETGSAASCNPDCTLPVCGDGVVGQGEECDAGPANSDTMPDACRTSCERASCGDRVVDTGEQCDDALSPDTCSGCMQLVVGSGGGAGSSGSAGSAGAIGSGGSVTGGSAGAPSTGGTPGSGGRPKVDDALEPEEDAGCGCRVVSSPRPIGAVWAALALSFAALRRRSGLRQRRPDPAAAGG